MTDHEALHILANSISIGSGLISRADAYRIAEIAEQLPSQPGAVDDWLARIALATEL